mgnify:CR=1 FL=1
MNRTSIIVLKVSYIIKILEKSIEVDIGQFYLSLVKNMLKRYFN